MVKRISPLNLRWPVVVIFLTMIWYGVFASRTGITAIDSPDLTQGKALFTQTRRIFYNAGAPLSEVRNNLGLCRDIFGKLPEDYEKYYWQAQIQFLLAETAEYSGDKKQAAQVFNESNELIRRALNYNPQSSEAIRIQADTIMRLIPYNGTVYMMTQGPRAFKLLNQALSLDKRNYQALNSLGIYYLNAPALGGGNVTKGIQALQKAGESREEFDNFLTAVWLGIAYHRKKEDNEAAKYYRKALAIYPNSPWVKGLLQQMKGAED